MRDSEIIELFFRRSETAISAAEEQYGRLCLSIARKILPDERDSEECVSDTWLRAWNAIPPERPASLRAWLARVTRNLALDRYDYNHQDKRSSALTVAFEELEGALITGSGGDMDAFLEGEDFRAFLNDFLRSLPEQTRRCFLRRYWYGDSVREIARSCHMSEGTVKSSLFRTRQRLKDALKERSLYD